MTVLLNENMNLYQTGLLYNPQLQSAEMAEKLFVVRQKQFELLLNKILQEKANSIPQHHLIIGQRGMGKTTLLKRIEVELHKKQYRQQFIPLIYREEQYNVKDLAEFWLNTLDALADSLQSEKCSHEMIVDIDKTIRELSRKSSKIISEESYEYLMNICHNLHRRPVLLIDNIGLIFSRLDNDKETKTEQWALRKLLSENGSPIIIGGGVTSTNYINDYNMPFYDFFQIQHLYKLNYEEFTKLLTNLAMLTNSDRTVIADIQENNSRQKSLLELTGGSPRLAVMLFEQIAKGFSSNVYNDLEILADAITPLYKARFEELPSQQQVILDAIALNWDAISLKELSKVTRMQNNQLSPQLKRLVNDGWLETTPAYKAKGNAYFINERFFNIYYLIRNSSRRHKDKIYCLSKFLECFYGKEELDKISDILLKQDIFSSEQMRLYLAVSNIKELNSNKRGKLQDKTFETFSHNEELCKEFNFSENDLLLSKAFSLYGLEQYSDAINCFDKIIYTNKKEKCALCGKGKSLFKTKKYADALVCFDELTKIEPNETTIWLFKGEALIELNRLDDALICFEKVLEIDDKKDYAWMQKGKILSEFEKYDDSIRCFDKAIKLNPKKICIRCNKGLILMKQKRFEEAIACCPDSIKLDCNCEFFWNIKIICLFEMKRYKEAFENFDKIIKLNPKNKKTWSSKAEFLLELENYEESIECYDKAIELDDNYQAAWNGKGFALVALKRYEEAALVYEKSISINPKNILQKFHLIFLYRDKLGEMDKAIELFNSITEDVNTDENNKYLNRFYLDKALFELHERNEGLAKEYLLQAFEFFEKEDKLSSMANEYFWIRFGSVVNKLGYSSWLLAILEEKGYDIVLSPYYTALQALEIEKRDCKNSKKEAEIYLNNRAIEISDPARIIIEDIKKYLD